MIKRNSMRLIKKILILALLIIVVNNTQAGVIKIMTYNIRLDIAVDGVNQWGRRINAVKLVINEQAADILCVQEALPNQIADIKKMMPGYNYVGVGREDGKQKGEFSAIYFRSNRFTLLQSNTFWLSPTPDEVGSIGWDAAITRICTYAQFRDKKDGKVFWVFNTHFDHIGEVARKESALIIVDKIAQLAANDAVFLAGDFNSEATSGAYHTIVQNTGHSFSDSYQPNGKECTFKGFEVASKECKRIDFVFIDGNMSLRTYQIITKNNGTYYPSDHLPVVVEVKLH